MAPRSLQVLVVDDNRSAADALTRVLRKGGDSVVAVYDGQAAIEHIHRSTPDLVLTDLKMAPVDGMQVLRAARAMRPPVEVIVFTAYGAVDTAVKAMRHGARDFLTKPVTVDQLSRRLDALRAGESEPPPDEDEFVFVAESPRSRHLLEALRMAAEVPSPIWLEGEIGAGRGHAARALHRFSRETELTVSDLGRDAPWPAQGTVLLPAVDNLPDDLQQRLHRSLQHLPPKVRVIATANPGGRHRVTEGTLRPELYYALAVIPIHVPPLRERREDIEPLLEFALTRFSVRYGRSRPTPTSGQLARLRQHAWPGNVRELLNVAERAVVMGSSAFEMDTVAPSTEAGLPRLEEGFSLSAYLEGLERKILAEAMRQVSGDRTRAGRLLGLERNTLRYKLNKYDLL